MADRYWFGGTGNWSDTAHWGTGTNGAGAPAAVPTSSDNVYFDVNSFSTGSQTVTVDIAAPCLNMDWTGATDNPTLAGAAAISLYGDLVFIVAMTYSNTGEFNFRGAGDVTLAGHALASCRFRATGEFVLQDEFNINGLMNFRTGTITTGNNDINANNIQLTTAEVKVFNLGSSTITTSGTNGWLYSGSNVTLNEGTSTIVINGTGAFTGGGLTYNNVELNGSAHTISGSNTFAKLTIASGTTCTVTFTDGTTQTITNPVLSGDATHQHTLTGTGTGGWAIVTGSNPTQVHYCTIDYGTITGGITYALVQDGNVNGGNNVGWLFYTSLGTNDIKIFVPAHLRKMFYHNALPQYKYAIHDGLHPYGWSTEGLVLYIPLWALKESSFKSVDANKYTCTPSGTTLFWTPNGWDLAGANEMIAIGNIGSSIRTLEFYFDPQTTTQSILEETDNVGVTVAGGTMSYGSWDNCYVDGSDTDTITAAWHHVVLLSSTNVVMTAFRLGLVDATFFDGRFGEIRAYSRLLSAGELTHNGNCTQWRY